MKNNEIIIRQISALNRENPLRDNESIIDDFNFTKELINQISSIKVYLRTKEECPYNIGNWIIDIETKDGGLHCLKLPINSEKQKVKLYVQPLIDILDHNKKSKMN